jgi:hypothetical protein
MYHNSPVFSVSLTHSHDQGYQARMRRQKAARLASRQAFPPVDVLAISPDPVLATMTVGPEGEQVSVPAALPRTEQKPRPIGRSIERAVRHRLGMHLKLDSQNVVSWRERYSDGSTETLYRELDAVHFIDYDTVCLIEIKFLTTDLMHALVGRRQLERSAWILSHAYRVIRTRLVYVGHEADRLRAGLPSTAIDDVEADFGVIWITPDQIEAAATSLGIVLPDGWSNLDARYGVEPHGIQARTAAFAENARSA